MPSIFASMDAPTVYAALGAVPTSNTAVTADTFRLLTIFLTNVGSVDRTVTVTNGAGVVLINAMLIPPNSFTPALQFAMMNVVGLFWVASGADVNGHVEGFPNV